MRKTIWTAPAAVFLGIMTVGGGRIHFDKSEVRSEKCAYEAVAQDGDDLIVCGTRYRIWGVDAYEMKQTCDRDGEQLLLGHLAKDFLNKVVAGRKVTCLQVGKKTSHNRIVGKCSADGIDVAQAIVEGGMALNCQRYSRGIYTEAQNKAISQRVGAWSCDQRPPDPQDFKNKHYCNPR